MNDDAQRPEIRRLTTSGIPLKAIYTSADLGGFDEARDLGAPGQPPFTRGVHASMYRGKPWTLRQYAGYASADDTNARFRYLLEQGQTGLSVAFDLPTQIGYDPDHPRSAGEVGRVGVSIATLADMEALFAGIPLNAVSTSMTINATAPVLLALYVATARRQGVDPAALRGTLQNDILKEYFARGTYIFPPGPSLRMVTDVVEYAANELPHWNAVSVSGYHIREAGATAVQEVAFALADGLAYATAAQERGLAPDDFLPKLSFFFAAQSHLLEEVAKFRAARRLWSRLVFERLKPLDPRSAALRFHTQTAGASLTAQQPMNNVVRVTVQALAAVLGGTQSLHTNAMDEALGLPTRDTAMLALRTQQILAEESGVADVVDPFAGSYAVEALTNEVEEAAHALIKRIDAMGGAVAAIETGWMAAQIAESAYEWQRAVEAGDRKVVGVNAYAEGRASAPEVLAIAPGLEGRRAAELDSFRRARDGAGAAAALGALKDAAMGTLNLVAPILAAVESGATLGEICDTLRNVFGEYRAEGAA